jgi:hypothetical protein
VRRAWRSSRQVGRSWTAWWDGGPLEQLEAELSDRFDQHPDAKIIRSLPGLGTILGARALGEFGDDPNRYADAKSRRNYAATSPITKASGKQRVVLARYARNRHLADICRMWAFAAITTSPGARAFYDQRRANGDTHNRALRALANRLVGILHGCLQPPHRLQRTHRLGPPHRTRRLTTTNPGMSRSIVLRVRPGERGPLPPSTRDQAPQAATSSLAFWDGHSAQKPRH